MVVEEEGNRVVEHAEIRLERFPPRHTVKRGKRRLGPLEHREGEGRRRERLQGSEHSGDSG